MALADRVTHRRNVATESTPEVGSDIERFSALTLEEFGRVVAQAEGGSAESTAGISVNRERALKLSAWWSGCRYLSETTAFLPAFIYRPSPGAGRTRRAHPPWRRRPAPGTYWQPVVESWVMAMLHRGNAFAWKLRNSMSQVTGLLPVHPDRVRYGITPDGHKLFEVRLSNGETVKVGSRELFHIPGLSDDGYYGLDAIRYHANTLGAVAAADEYADRFYAKGGQMTAYIQYPGELTDQELERRTKQWRRLHQGIGNAHEFGALADGAEYKTVGLDAEQTQIIGSRQFGVTEVCRALRIPPHKVYDLTHATFTNIEHQSIESVVDSIRPWVLRIEAAVLADPDLLRSGNYLEFTLEGLLRGDTTTRYGAYSSAITAGWMSPAEPREKENLPPVEGLDYYNVPLAMRQIRADGSPIVVPGLHGDTDEVEEEPAT